MSDAFSSTEQRRQAAKQGMWLFLATEALLFGVLFVAYTSQRITWSDAFAEACHHTKLWLGTANTAILIVSSLLIAVADERARAGERFRGWLVGTALLGAVFLGIKFTEYGLEYHEGLVPFLGFDSARYGPGVYVFFGFYFLVTGLHALHLTVGVVLVSWLAWRGRARASKVQAVALYWHLVDIVWVFVFPLFYLVDRHG